MYSPVAALSSYVPLVASFSARDQTRLAATLFLYVLAISLTALWIGEFVLDKVLGISTDALVVTGGVALILEGVHLMTGPEDQFHVSDLAASERSSWRSVAFMPLTFPLTIGGTTFAILVAFSADVPSVVGTLFLSVAAAAYALVTGITIYAAGHVSRRASDRTQVLLGRLAGILLTAIAVTILISGTTRLVHAVWAGLS